MEFLTPIIVALIMGPIVALIQKMRKENSSQHGEVAEAIDRIEEKLDSHISWHLYGPLKKNKTKTAEKKRSK